MSCRLFLPQDRFDLRENHIPSMVPRGNLAAENYQKQWRPRYQGYVLVALDWRQDMVTETWERLPGFRGELPQGQPPSPPGPSSDEEPHGPKMKPAAKAKAKAKDKKTAAAKAKDKKKADTKAKEKKTASTKAKDKKKATPK